MDKDNPLSRILEHVGTLPVLGFIFSAFEILERLEFISKKTGELKEFSMTLGGAVTVLVICVLWLSGIGLWPKIKPRLPVFKAHKTVREMLKDVEENHIPNSQCQYAAWYLRLESVDAHIGRHKNIPNKITSLENKRTMVPHGRQANHFVHRFDARLAIPWPASADDRTRGRQAPSS